MSIFEFLDYRRFLRRHIDHLPKKGRGEVSRIAQAAGVHPSLLSQVLTGDKNLSLEQAQIIAEYLDLTHQETEYFLLMVQHQRAGTAKLRTYFAAKMDQVKK